MKIPAGRLHTGSSLVQLLRRRAREQPDRRLYTFLANGEAESAHLTYGELDRAARAIGARLQASGAARGDRVLLLYPPGLDFVAAFFGCLYAGAAAVPAYPPRPGRPERAGRPGQPGRSDERLAAIARDARPALVLTTARLLSRAAELAAADPALGAARWLSTDDLGDDPAGAWREPSLGPGDLAFLQYTSGSTAEPKGVMVSHGNLLANEEIIRAAFAQSAASVVVGWLPLYHDMGLIGNVLQPLYSGGRCVLFSPQAFLQRPRRWLEAITRYRATTSGGPDFAYDLCVRRIPEADRAGLDLKSWKVAYDGAEPVSAATLERFAAAFAPCGFDRAALYPCYGLAEATLFVAGGDAGAPPAVAALQAQALARGEAAMSEAADAPDGPVRRLVSCGRVWGGQRLQVVDAESAVPLPPGRVGEIWVAGPSVALGYWEKPEETAAVFRAVTAAGDGPWLRTGDLGFLLGGELFIAGRAKDLVILRGRNLYPQDVERTAEGSHPSLRAGGAAAFSVDGDGGDGGDGGAGGDRSAGGGERLVVLQEVERGALGTADGTAAILAALREAVAREHEAPPHEVVLLPPGALPRTSSGKLRRGACRALYLAGELPDLGRSVLPAAPAADDLPADWLGASGETDLESELAARVARLAGVPAAGLDPDRSLAALGIDSLRAAQLQQEIAAGLGADVELADLLAGPTVRELAQRIAEARRAEREPGLAGWGAPAGEPFPLSYGQRALWFLQRLEPASAAYNVNAALRVRGGLDAAALRACFERLAERHEALRLVCWETQDGPRQRARGAADGPAIDFAEENAAGWDEARVAARLAAAAHRPFDLERDPLLRLLVLRTGPAEHAVLLSIHHIAADLASLEVLARELSELYPDPARTLPPAPAYRDYVARQQERLAGTEGARLWAYWRQRLAGDLPPLDLPVDRPRPPFQTFRGAARAAVLDRGLAARVRSLGGERRATLATTLLAGFELLLSRLSGQTDLLVGMPAAGRPLRELAAAVGYFVNPVVVRTDLSGEPGFDGVLARTREAALAAVAHQELPFPLLVERLQPERDPARSPLFQAMFVLQRSAPPELAAFALHAGDLGGRGETTLELAGLTLEPLALEQRAAQVDLELMAAETARGIELVLLYNSDLFDGTTAERFLGHFGVLLGAAADDPARRADELPLLTAAEHRQLVAGWNDTAAPFLLDRAFHELFAEQAARTPRAPAAFCGDASLTYGELERRAGRLAAALTTLPGVAGLRREEPVAVWSERGLDLLTAMLGIWKAGGVYTPLNPEHPTRRLLQVLAESGSRRVLASGDCLRRCREALSFPGAPAVLSLPEILEREGAPPAALPEALPGSLAYLLFTSGSTGVPKGVMIEHRGMLNHLCAKVRDLGVTSRDRIAQTAPPTFDISIWQFLAALLAGGSVRIFADDVVRDPLRLVGEVDRHGITILETVPSLLAALLDAAGDDSADARSRPALARLRWLVPTGESLAPELCRRWLAAYPRVPLVNAYGPTECSDDVTHHFLFAPPPPEVLRTPIGRPLANLQVHVLDRCERGLPPLPLGVPGELCAGGAGVGRGYLGDPARTALAFVPDPHSTAPGSRLYRTGDLGRRLPGGDLEFLGRLDDQVKIRGVRIELGEVAAAIVAQPGVNEAAVVVRPDRRGDPQLVAYWTAAAGGADADGASLRDRLRESLPEAMVPAFVVPLAALPRTAHGKLDRRALPAPDWDSVEGRAAAAPAAPAAPADDVERLVAGIFTEVLGGAAEIGREESFFDLGGHSLLATQAVARLRAALGVDLPLRALFEAPTAAGLAARVRLATAGGASVAPPIAPLPRGSVLPLSFAQERLWFLHRLEPESPVYNLPGAVRMRGALSIASLARSLDLLVARHEALRTTFGEVDGEPQQVVAESLAAELPLVDLAGLPPASAEAAVRGLGSEESRRPFDLASGPLLRARLLRLAAGDHLLLLTLHHIVSDGWSQGVLVRELSAAYGAFAAGRRPDLPALPVQYADFARWQRDWLEGGALAAQLPYWRQRLAGELPELALPADRPRPPRRRHRGRRLPLAVPRERSLGLARLARRQAVTPFMALLALFQALLHRLGAGGDLLVGSPIANRQRVELEGIVGFFANTLVLRGQVRGQRSLADLCRQARETALGAYAHQDVPFERLVDELQPARDLARSPLFQTLFILQNAPLLPLSLSGLAIEVAEVDNGTAKFDLTLSLEETAGGLTGWFEYDCDLFDRATVVRLSRCFQNLLAAGVESPELAVAELPLLGAAERAQLLREWNDTAADFPASGVVALFAAQARRTPAAVAVARAGRGELTYGELDARSNRLARHLRRLGVETEVLVGICAERTPELVVALLAVLKAGGAYVPLDPLYPRERLAWMLEDAGARLVLTQTSLLSSLPHQAGRILLLDREDWPDEGEESDASADSLARLVPLAPLVIAPPPESLAYVLFTSGSTGRPKGVQVTHGALANFLASMRRSPGLRAGDVLLAVTTLSFDIAGLEIYLPLIAGARVVLAGREVAADGARLAAELARAGATAMQATPATWRLLLETGWEGSRGFLALCGGEALPAGLARRLAARAGRVWNLYGPTETTIWSALQPVAAGSGGAASAAVVPIGWPIANTAIHLLDGDFAPVPLGVAGEIAIGGRGVARGYRGRGGSTGERFVPDPFSELPGERLYRTGDLGRRRADGTLEFLGRIDSQVKVRGFRIELGEIEAALEAHPAISRAVAALRVVGGVGGERAADGSDAAGEQRLVAWFVAAGEAPPEPRALRDFLRSRLPEFMLPAAFVALDDLPLTPNGKVDRRALPAPAAPAAAGREAGFVAPSGPVEEVVAEVWARVLGVPRVGAADDFFALGGHSLLATRVMSRLAEAFPVRLPLAALFESPTVAGLARAVAAARGGRRPVPPLTRLPRGDRQARPLELSFAQERLWVMSRLAPDNPVYNVFQALRIDGLLDDAALARSFDEVLRRHEALRTAFPTASLPSRAESPAVRARGPRQAIAPFRPGVMARVDLTALEAAAAEREGDRLAAAAARLPFDLARGPLFRAALLLLAPGSRLLLLSLHHIVCDDGSIGLLVQEVGALYRAFRAGAPSPLSAPPVQYADYAAWQRRWLQGETLAAELAPWLARLGGELPVLALPTDRPRPEAQSFRGAAEPFALPAGLGAALREAGRSESATLFMTLLAAFAALLHRAAGQDEVVVGTPVAGRDRVEIETLIGFFVNILPLRIDLSGAPTYRQLLRRVRAVALEAYDHADVPFEKLVEALAPRRDLGRAAIRQVGFAFQESAPRPIELPGGVSARPVAVDAGVARLDLTLFLWEGEHGLQGVCEYATDLFRRDTMVRFLDGFHHLLADMAGGLDRPLATLPPLVAPEVPASGASAAAAPTADLTEPQLLFWFAHKLNPGERLYFDRATATFTVAGNLDPRCFERAFRRLVAGCDLLRSRIQEVDGVPRRTVVEAPPPPLDVFDFAVARDPEAAFRDWLAGRCRREIDLEVRPYDAALARLGPERSVWFFSVHHVVADARTLQILARQLSRLYELELAGRREEAPPLPAFAECVAGEAADRLSDRYRRARRYWEEKLARPAAPNPFYGRPDAAPTTRTERLSIELDDDESAKVRELAARRGLFSASVVFAGALFALLGRLSGERRLRLGTPFANRPDRLRDVPGLMVIAAPLEVEIAPGETFASLLRKVQKELVAAARHQPYPVRNPVEAPAYDVYFNFQTMAFRDFCGQPVSFELLHSGHSLDRLDLQVSDFAASGRYRLDFDFNQAAFGPGERARTQAHYLSLLRALLANDEAPSPALPHKGGGRTAALDLPLSEAPLLSPEELQELSAFNATRRIFATPEVERGQGRARTERNCLSPKGEFEHRPQPDPASAPPALLHALFEAQASATPDAIAVAAEEGELTYAELDRRAARLADFLRLSGASLDALVGVAMERSLDMVVALLGILKAGAAYVPIDPTYPQERIAWMLADARAPVLLTQSRLGPFPAPAGTRVVALDAAGPAIYAAAAGTPFAEVPPVPSSAGAYMIYTSGSTGRPKGVLVPHEGIVNRLLWMQEAYGLAADDRVLQKTPYSFDVSVWEFFWPLLTGACLVMARPGGHQDPAYLVSAIAGQGITTVHFVPSMLRIFLEQPGVDLCGSLRRVIASGEALTETLVARYHERLQAPLHNLYGPTEASVDVTAWHCRPDDDFPFVPIGRPIANITIQVLDADLNLLPVGIPGELHIGGVGLARGYHGRPELTAERFVPDPWADAARPGARLYKTGDLARHLPGGAVEYLGRIDHQVKIRGFRIELGEIESVLAQFPGVRQAAALCRLDGGRGEPRLVAYFVPEPGWGPSATQLRGYLQSRLPDFMVPAALVALDALPLTASGKVDRRALPAPAPAAAEPETGGAAARPPTPLESLIASVCAEVLGLDEVPLEANFFDLGGNSLSATQVVTLLQEVLPVEIDLRQVFEGPTVAKLAAALEEERSALSERERQVMAEILAEFEAGMSAEM